MARLFDEAKIHAKLEICEAQGLIIHGGDIGSRSDQRFIQSDNLHHVFHFIYWEIFKDVRVQLPRHPDERPKRTQHPEWRHHERSTWSRQCLVSTHRETATIKAEILCQRKCLQRPQRQFTRKETLAVGVSFTNITWPNSVCIEPRRLSSSVNFPLRPVVHIQVIECRWRRKLVPLRCRPYRRSLVCRNGPLRHITYFH